MLRLQPLEQRQSAFVIAATRRLRRLSKQLVLLREGAVDAFRGFGAWDFDRAPRSAPALPKPRRGARLFGEVFAPRQWAAGQVARSATKARFVRLAR